MRHHTYIFNTPEEFNYMILYNVFLSVLAFFVTVKMIPPIAKLCKAKNIFGRDINKPPKDTVPESAGIVSGTIYILTVMLFTLIFTNPLGEYNAAMTSICFMLLLGFVDDVLELRWRYKIILPAIAGLPLLAAYTGLTTIIVPIPLRSLFGSELDLGILYKAYMWMLSIFCGNAINIYAGINGLEAGQSVVIAISVLIHNVIEFGYLHNFYADAHLFSFFMMTPFIGTTFGLLWYNWYPSQVFVGDSFTCFSGMTLAVVGILGHFSKTLLLFFIPQILNFTLSIPQLIGIVACPRHRLPKFNPNTGLLENSKNYTLINFFLWILGPMHEKTLCQLLLFFQVLCCAFGFFIRYYVAQYFFDTRISTH